MDKEEVKTIIEEMRTAVNMLEGEVDDERVRGLIDEKLLSDPRFTYRKVDEMKALMDRIFLALRRDLYILDPLLRDKEVNEIMVNGPEAVYTERKGRLVREDVTFESEKALTDIMQRLAGRVDREINELHPIVDARLAGGSRVNGVHGSLSLHGPLLTIRKFPESTYSMEDLISFGMVSEVCAAFLKVMVESGYNIFISGGTSSGKTTFLNALSEYIPAEQRVVVIEDSAELAIHHIPNLVRMECRQSNGEGKGDVAMDRLIKTSLRMRPDRIIVGEVRGKEVVEMIKAMNTGHDGSLSTGHGNSIRGMLRRLESMFLQGTDFPLEAIRSQIGEGLDIMIHLGRLGGKRMVLEVAELREEEGKMQLNYLFRYVNGKGLLPTGLGLQNTTKLTLYGGPGYPPLPQKEAPYA